MGPRDPGMDTPRQELADPRAPGGFTPMPPRLPPRGLFALLALGYGRGFSHWRGLLVILAVQLLLALTIVMPFQQALAARMDGHIHAPALAGSPDEIDSDSPGWSEGGLHGGLWRDVKRLDAALIDGLGIAMFWVCVVAWLFGAFAAGGLLGTTRGAERAGGFLSEGARFFPRLLRLGLLALLLYYALGRIVLEAWALSVEGAEMEASSETVGFWGERIREGVMLFGFLWICVAADLGRAEMVVHDRRSAFAAFFRGFGWTFRRPIRTTFLALLIGVPIVALQVGLGFLSRGLDDGSTGALIGLFLTGQFAVLIAWYGRAALLEGNAMLVRS